MMIHFSHIQEWTQQGSLMSQTHCSDISILKKNWVEIYRLYLDCLIQYQSWEDFLRDLCFFSESWCCFPYPLTPFLFLPIHLSSHCFTQLLRQQRAVEMFFLAFLTYLHQTPHNQIREFWGFFCVVEENIIDEPQESQNRMTDTYSRQKNML